MPYVTISDLLKFKKALLSGEDTEESIKMINKLIEEDEYDSQDWDW